MDAVLIVNWLELFVQEVDSESFESVNARDLKTKFHWWPFLLGMTLCFVIAHWYIP